MDYEWRFTETSATHIASIVARGEGPTLCIGAPSVFATLSMAGHSATLIDRNPILAQFLVQRFGGTVVTSDVADLSSATLGRRYRTIVLDAPWYPEYILFWLSRALRVAEPKARLLFSLFSKLTRPSAERERTDLLSCLSSRVGALRVHSPLAYLTPLFEQETLLSAKLPHCPEWRSGELIELCAEHPKGLQPIAPPREPSWKYFAFGAQVVGVKTDNNSSDELDLAPLYADGSYLLKTVSRRHPVRPSIGIWTSRNRGARVTGVAKLTQVLVRLQSGETPTQVSRDVWSEREMISLRRLFALIGV